MIAAVAGWWGLWVGCATPEPAAKEPVDPAPIATGADDDDGLPPRPSWLGDAHGEALGDAEPPAPAAAGRPLRRMDIDQLNATLRAVTGVGWEINGVDQFEVLASTLGRPDYSPSTAEDLQPSLLFQKFLDDAANAVCDELVAREAPGGAGNVFLVHVAATDSSVSNPTGVEDNLQAALLRFHGNVVPDGDPRLAPWSWLFDTTVDVTGGDTEAAWRAVCIGLVTHPDFTMY